MCRVDAKCWRRMQCINCQVVSDIGSSVVTANIIGVQVGGEMTPAWFDLSPSIQSNLDSTAVIWPFHGLSLQSDILENTMSLIKIRPMTSGRHLFVLEQLCSSRYLIELVVYNIWIHGILSSDKAPNLEQILLTNTSQGPVQHQWYSVRGAWRIFSNLLIIFAQREDQTTR